MIEGFGSDLRPAWRRLSRRPGWTVLLLLCIGLGISLNVVVFSFVDQVLLHPLPFPDSGELVVVEGRQGTADDQGSALSPPTLDDLVRELPGLASVGAYTTKSFVQSGDDWPLRLVGAQVSEGFFRTLRVEAAPGRTFLPGDFCTESPGVLIDQDLWRTRFGADAGILGTEIELDERRYRVLGVVPDRLRYPPKAQVWTPLCIDRKDSTYHRENTYLRTIGRLRPDTELDQGKEALRSFAASIRQGEHEGKSTAWTLEATLLEEVTTESSRGALTSLTLAVGFVLLIACVNIAGLLTAQAVARKSEISTRLTLGAGFFRLGRQLLTESTLLALLGALSAWPLAVWLHGLALRFASHALPSDMHSLSPTPRLLAFTMGLALFSGVFFGLAPLVFALDLRKGLGNLSRLSSSDRRGRRLMSSLVVFEVAAATTLLVGAALMLLTVGRLLRIDPGFSPDDVHVLRMHISHAKFNEEPHRIAFHRNLVERAGSVPGVEAVASVSTPPFSGMNWAMAVSREDRADEVVSKAPTVNLRIVSPSYFETLGIPLRSGRDFGPGDRSDSLRTAVVDERAAELLWPGEDPVGKRLHLGTRDEEAPWLTVVGTVGNVAHGDLEGQSDSHLYLPYDQFPLNVLHLVVASPLSTSTLLPQLRAVVAEIDPSVAASSSGTFREAIGNHLAGRRFTMFLLTAFALFGWLLAALGIWGVTAFGLSHRQREIQIRLALGAPRHTLLKTLVKESLVPVALGAVLGGVGAFWLSELLSGLVFGTRNLGLWAYAGALAAVAIVALPAVYLPAKRQIDRQNLAVLRAE